LPWRQLAIGIINVSDRLTASPSPSPTPEGFTALAVGPSSRVQVSIVAAHYARQHWLSAYSPYKLLHRRVIPFLRPLSSCPILRVSTRCLLAAAPRQSRPPSPSFLTARASPPASATPIQAHTSAVGRLRHWRGKPFSACASKGKIPILARRELKIHCLCLTDTRATGDGPQACTWMRPWIPSTPPPPPPHLRRPTWKQDPAARRPGQGPTTCRSLTGGQIFPKA
jgi:hypothetical protein